MGIRESLNQNPRATTGITIGIIILAIAVFFWMHRGNNRPDVKIPEKCYYCDEDGGNLFIDDVKNVPPFDHNGKPAYRAIVLKYVNIKDKKVVVKPAFVDHLEQFDEASKKKIEASIKSGSGTLAAQYQYSGGLMIKKPPKGKWVQIKELSDSMSQKDRETAAKDAEEFSEIMARKAPSGTTAVPVGVEENALSAKPE